MRVLQRKSRYQNRSGYFRLGALAVLSVAAYVAVCNTAGAQENLDQQLDAGSSFGNSADALTPSAKTLSESIAASKPFTFSVTAGGGFNSNVLMAASDPVDGFSANPKVGLEWSTGETFVWTIGGGYTPARASEVGDQFDTDTINLGANVKIPGGAATLLGFVPIFGYEFNNVDVAFFEMQKADFHDFSARLVREWLQDKDSPYIRLTFAATRRWADPVSQDKSTIASELYVARKFGEQTTVGITLFAGQAWYYETTNDGRSDQTVRGRFEIKYDFVMPNDQKLALALVAQFTQNYSNRDLARSNGWLIGPVLTWKVPF